MDSQTSAPAYRLGFIGGGKLAGSVIRGLVRAKYCAPGLILVSEPNEASRRILEHELGVTGTAENAEVAVDGNFVGNAPVNLKLASGKHTIVVTAKGYQAFTREITVMSDSEVRLTANLEQ